MSKQARLILMVMALAGIAAVVAAVRMAPQPIVPADVVAADEVERRWATVTAWAGAPDALGYAPLAERVARRHSPWGEAVEAAADWPTGGPVPTLSETLVHESDRTDQTQLLAWGEAPLYGGPCNTKGLNLMALRTRLRVALATADAAHVDRARAVLATANSIRARAGMLTAMIGASLALDVARWASDRQVPAWPALAAAAPTAAEFRVVVAREALCAAELVRGEADALSGAGGAVLRRSLVAWMLHSHATLASLRGPNPTFATLRSLLAPRPGEAALEDPIVKTMALDLAAQLKDFEGTATEHARLVASLPAE